jgi:hypothetical protein
MRIAMAEKGIVGRGILLDFHSWRLAIRPDIEYDAFKAGSIPLEWLKDVADWQGTEVKFGDILFIRSGTYTPHIYIRMRESNDLADGDG